VQTRREAVILMTAIPLLSTDAVAQPDRLDALFDLHGLSVPSRVRQRYAILAYYIQLLNLQRPMRSSFEIDAAIKTYQLVGESIARSDAKFEGEVPPPFVQSLRQAFSKSEEELWAFLRQVGIDQRLLAGSIIEECLASNMLFYGAETRVTNVTDMLWCCRSALDAPLRMAEPAQVAPHRNFERQLVTSLYAGRIPKDAKTADLSAMQSTKFELVINAQTATMLGSKSRRRCSRSPTR
jgi:hypothetical protein